MEMVGVRSEEGSGSERENAAGRVVIEKVPVTLLFQHNSKKKKIVAAVLLL